MGESPRGTPKLSRNSPAKNVGPTKEQEPCSLSHHTSSSPLGTVRLLRALLDGPDYQLAARLVYEDLEQDLDQVRDGQVEYQRRASMISAAGGTWTVNAARLFGDDLLRLAGNAWGSRSSESERFEDAVARGTNPLPTAVATGGSLGGALRIRQPRTRTTRGVGHLPDRMFDDTPARRVTLHSTLAPARRAL